MLVAVTPGTAATAAGTESLSCPLPLTETSRSALIAWSTLLVADSDSDAPNTAIADTRASPTMSAEAVCAVRRGLRMEFSRPSCPGVPSSAASGRPSTLDSGRAIAGASIATPTKTHTAPTPTSATTGFDSPMASSATPDDGERRTGNEPSPGRAGPGTVGRAGR